MPAQILDGRAIAAELRASLGQQTSALRERGIHPRLLVGIVGQDEASIAYVSGLEKTGRLVGVEVAVATLPATAGEEEVRDLMQRASADPDIHGVLLQQPLPRHLSIRAVADAIPPGKDVDGTNPANQGLHSFGRGRTFVPATPAAVMIVLERSAAWPLQGRNAVVVGRSSVVGLPVSLLLLAQNATVTVTHGKTVDLGTHTRRADVLVSATGVPGLIGAGMVAPGATVIDVGTTMVEGKLRGDVDFAAASEVAAEITPVPGGIGPVTNVALMRNVVRAAAEQHEIAL